jgi:disulfide bond formation protein DsbB
MSPLAQGATVLLSTGTLLSNVAFIVAVVMFLFFRKQTGKLWQLLGERGTLFAFAFGLFSFVGAFVYSRITGFPACPLCWSQRIFLGLALMTLGMGVYRNIRVTIPALVFTLCGAGVAVYQYVLQYLAVNGGGYLPCPAVSFLPSCDKIYILEYGYITIPMMALSTFVWMAFLLMLEKRQHSIPKTGTTTP